MTAGRELDALVAEKVMGIELVQEIVSGEKFTDGKPRIGYRLCYQNGEIVGPRGGGVYGWGLSDTKEGAWFYCPPYSTSIDAAWQVAEKMARDGWDYNLEWKGATRNYAFTAEGYFAKWVDGHHMIHHAVADTVPLHICLAALKAVGVEV